eukprot:scaffold162830_cov52-Attheya_sp.AAC.9
MQSCKYLTVTAKDEDRGQTKRLRIKNIRFFRRHKELSHNDPRLASADSVTITFEYQKNDERNDSVTMHRTGDMLLCPVISWAAIVQRVLSYPSTDKESPVNTMYNPNTEKLSYLSSVDMCIRLCAAASILGIAKLGFNPEDIGTHSLRSGAAMAMYLAGVPWSSDAFLHYIRKQVEMFSHNVSIRMIQNDHFFTTPNYSPNQSRTDHRQSSHSDNFASTGAPGHNRGRNATFNLAT